LCANLHVAECNWLVKMNSGIDAAEELCASCTLTRGRSVIDPPGCSVAPSPGLDGGLCDLVVVAWRRRTDSVRAAHPHHAGAVPGEYAVIKYATLPGKHL